MEVEVKVGRNTGLMLRMGSRVEGQSTGPKLSMGSRVEKHLEGMK